MKKLIFIAGLFITLTACKHGNGSVVTDKLFAPPVVKPDREVVEAKMSELPPPNADINADAPVGNADTKVTEADGNGNTSSVADTSKKITKDGTLEFETANLDVTRVKILGLLKKYGGYLDEDDQTTSGDENRKEYELKIRVPVKNFDSLVSTVSSTAIKMDSKSVTVTDVTTQFIDINARLNNKKLLEKRYQELLGKATSMQDILAVENKLTEIRSDIESTQGQLNYLNKQVAYSSLDVTFYIQQVAHADSGDGFWFKFKAAIIDGWNTVQIVFFWLVSCLPLIIVLIVIYLLIKLWRRKRIVLQESKPKD